MTHTIKDYYKCVINFIHSGSQVFQGTGFKPAFHERRKHERKNKRKHKSPSFTVKTDSTQA